MVDVQTVGTAGRVGKIKPLWAGNDEVRRTKLPVGSK